jgi:hypothetical protein
LFAQPAPRLLSLLLLSVPNYYCAFLRPCKRRSMEFSHMSKLIYSPRTSCGPPIMRRDWRMIHDALDAMSCMAASRVLNGRATLI